MSDTATLSNNDGGSILSNWIIPILWKSGTVIVGLTAIIAGLLYKKQNSLLYFPEIGGIPRRSRNNPRRYRSPQEYDIPFEEHFIVCEDGVSIHAWLLKYSGGDKNTPVILFFHGNAGNIGLRLPNAVAMYNHLKCHILLVEYRGYGDSDSVPPTEAGLKLDAEASLNFAVKTLQFEQIYIFGRSLGGGVALHLMDYYHTKSQLPKGVIKGIIVENTFLSISKMVDVVMPWFVSALKGFVLRIDWNSERLLFDSDKNTIPILFIAGKKDELVPHSHMKRLYDLSKHRNSQTKLYVVPNGTHNETWVQAGKMYWVHFNGFIQRTNNNNNSNLEQITEEDKIDNDNDYLMVDDSMSSFRKRRSSAGETTSSVPMGHNDNNIQKSSSSSAIPMMPTNILDMMTNEVSSKNKKKE